MKILVLTFDYLRRFYYAASTLPSKCRALHISTYGNHSLTLLLTPTTLQRMMIDLDFESVWISTSRAAAPA